MLGRPSPSHMQEFQTRGDAGGTIPRGAGLSGARGFSHAQTRLHLESGGGVRDACALAASWLLGNRVKEEPSPS